jgi:hypothetical protein
MLKNKMVIGAAEIRARLGISEATFMLMIHQKKLPAKLNEKGIWEIPEVELRALELGREERARASKKKRESKK